ncbi:hypothetical protein ACWGAN_04360 [Streptomyces sp. NPDC054945]
MTEIVLQDNREPDRRPLWRSRAEKQALRGGQLRADLAQIAARSATDEAYIRAEGQARLRLSWARFTTLLTVESAREYRTGHQEIAQLRESSPDDHALALALGELEETGLRVLKRNIEDHGRDGRSRFA